MRPSRIACRIAFSLCFRSKTELSITVDFNFLSGQSGDSFIGKCARDPGLRRGGIAQIYPPRSSFLFGKAGPSSPPAVQIPGVFLWRPQVPFHPGRVPGSQPAQSIVALCLYKWDRTTTIQNLSLRASSFITRFTSSSSQHLIPASNLPRPAPP